MKYFFLLTFCNLLNDGPIDLRPMHDQLQGIEMFFGDPPEMGTDTCYHHGGLLKLDIDKNSKITNIQFNDSASVWLREGLEEHKKKKIIRYAKLDSIARVMKLKDCSLIFPFVAESGIFPCGIGPKKPLAPYGYFLFNGQLLQGTVYFGEDIRFYYPVKIDGCGRGYPPGLPIKPPRIPEINKKKTN